ncbi:hypothetical protein COO60DRAFT_724358 [Scenedesmus sp. NREL 46B-D3]|nr:hypothetical protein COO60DRAFT_724358 [Scenedesmus sp. NREL 46B-D3]
MLGQPLPANGLGPTLLLSLLFQGDLVLPRDIAVRIAWHLHYAAIWELGQSCTPAIASTCVTNGYSDYKALTTTCTLPPPCCSLQAARTSLKRACSKNSVACDRDVQLQPAGSWLKPLLLSRYCDASTITQSNMRILMQKLCRSHRLL